MGSTMQWENKKKAKLYKTMVSVLLSLSDLLFSPSYLSPSYTIREGFEMKERLYQGGSTPEAMSSKLTIHPCSFLNDNHLANRLKASRTLFTVKLDSKFLIIFPLNLGSK